LTFLPALKRLLSIVAAHHGLSSAKAAASVVYPAVTSRAGQVERARAAPACAERVLQSHFFYPPPATRKGAHPYAHRFSAHPVWFKNSSATKKPKIPHDLGKSQGKLHLNQKRYSVKVRLFLKDKESNYDRYLFFSRMQKVKAEKGRAVVD
jgi:hypothetical protein